MPILKVIEYLGAISAFVYLVIVTRRSWFAWPAYIASSLLYIPVFWHAQLYADATLQLYFVLMGFYSWWLWKREGRDHVQVVSWSLRTHLLIIIAIILSSLLLGFYLSTTPAGLYGYSDALISISSVVTTVLTARKVLESWWYWICINCIATIVFSMRGLEVVTVLLYIVYIALSVRALFAWKRSLLPSSQHVI